MTHLTNGVSNIQHPLHIWRWLI